MNEGSSGSGSAPPGGADGEVTRTFPPHDPVTRPQVTEPGNQPPYAPTETVQSHPQAESPAHLPTETVRHGPGPPAVPPGGQAHSTAAQVRHGDHAPEVVRYGPGVPAAPPAGAAGLTAERVWQARGPAGPGRRRARIRRLAGPALTVILLAASAVVLYLRFHHAPFRVTGVVVTEQASTGCGVDVTGRITTNGSAGTVSYQWVFQPGTQPPQPLSQSALAGQQAVYVTAAIEGTGTGSASQTVTLQVLGPDPMTASIPVVIKCR